MKFLKEMWHVILISIMVATMFAAGVCVAYVDYGVFHDKFPNATVFDWIWSGGK
jgi:hypothetical protein